jgi:hypothetical protein
MRILHIPGGPVLGPAPSDAGVPEQAAPLPGLDYRPRGAGQPARLPQEKGLGTQVEIITLFRVLGLGTQVVIITLFRVLGLGTQVVIITLFRVLGLGTQVVIITLFRVLGLGTQVVITTLFFEYRYFTISKRIPGTGTGIFTTFLVCYLLCF